MLRLKHIAYFLGIAFSFVLVSCGGSSNPRVEGCTEEAFAANLSLQLVRYMTCESIEGLVQYNQALDDIDELFISESVTADYVDLSSLGSLKNLTIKNAHIETLDLQGLKLETLTIESQYLENLILPANDFHSLEIKNLNSLESITSSPLTLNTLIVEGNLKPALLEGLSPAELIIFSPNYELDDLPALDSLKELRFHDVKVTEVTFDKYPKLESLYLGGFSTDSLSILGQFDLSFLELVDVKLDQLTFSEHGKLGSLKISGGEITEIKGASSLETKGINIDGSRLGSLPLADFPNLISLRLWHSAIVEDLDFSESRALERLNILDSDKTSIDLSATKLRDVSLKETALESITFPNLSSDEIGGELSIPRLQASNLQIQGGDHFATIFLTGSEIQSLDIDELTGARSITISSPNLSEIDLPKTDSIEVISLDSEVGFDRVSWPQAPLNEPLIEKAEFIECNESRYHDFLEGDWIQVTENLYCLIISFQ